MKYLSCLSALVLYLPLIAQQPDLQVDGYLRLDPPASPVINLQPGIIHFDETKGVFLGYNGSNWVPLSKSAQIDVQNCPDPGTDMIHPRPRCHTSMTVALDNTGNTSLFVQDFDLGTTDNCGSFTSSFDMGSVIEKLDYSCGEVGSQLVRIYFTDAQSNQNFCDVLVQVQDNLGSCAP